MVTKLLYLDDERSDEVEPYAREMEHAAPNLRIEVEKPIAFVEQLERLKQSDFDGIILDLRLDQYAHKVGYRATSLAQEIRTRASEGGRDFPIFLWSTDAKLQASYTKDFSGHDLFDLKTVKKFIHAPENPNQLEQLGLQMTALAKGYHDIQTAIKGSNPVTVFIRCLGWDKTPDFLDPRMLAPFELRSGRLPAHEFARFIVYYLLDNPGPLLDEVWLAARLGIDRATSPDFRKLLQTHLKDAAYTGLFAYGWPRWWASMVESWWLQLPGAPGPLRLVKAEERVAFLRKQLRLRGLSAATPLRTEDSSAFWVICQVTKHPLDPRDGLVLENPSGKLWNEKLYISVEAALKRTPSATKLSLDPLERERFKRLQTVSRQARSTKTA